MSLEKIVRPALPGDINPPKPQAKNRTRTGWKPVELSFGAGEGSPKIMSGSYSLQLQYFAVKKPKEQKGGSGSGFLGIEFP